MNKIQSFEEYLTSQSQAIVSERFLLNLLLTGLLAYLLNLIYIKFGRSLSNKKDFANNFIIIALTTMFIITVVKSSLALSLGLVGALSIVRFRAAIKEPEELSYLFVAIGIGLGLGAEQIKITLIAFTVIGGILIFRGFFRKKENLKSNLFLTISGNSTNVTLEKISDLLKNYCRNIILKRLDESGDQIEASFAVEFNDYEALNLGKQAIRDIDSSINFSLVESTEIPI